MRFCFIVEALYRNESMPLDIADQLVRWGHEVDLLEPDTTITCLSDLPLQDYDAYVLKTVSEGPGLSLLEAAEVVGIPTINSSRSIRLVRDKTIATAFAQSQGLPIPLTYFVAHPHLLAQIPEQDYPLVVKPTNGSSCRGIYRVDSPAGLARLDLAEANHGFFLAQHYLENRGFDIKLYVAGAQVYGVAKRSPLHPEVEVNKRLIPISQELRKLALRVGKIFGLDIYGLDVLETRQGFAVVDINDFPSFGQVPHAVSLVSAYVQQLASRARLQRMVPTRHMQRRFKEVIGSATHRLNLTRAFKHVEGQILSSPDEMIQSELSTTMAPEEAGFF